MERENGVALVISERLVLSIKLRPSLSGKLRRGLGKAYLVVYYLNYLSLHLSIFIRRSL